jgi:hypothetical protein
VVTVSVTGTRAMTDKPKLAAPPRQAQETAGTDCSQYYGQLTATGVPSAYGRPLTWAPCGYTPNQLRSALYAKSSGLTGKGVTVAIISGDNDSTAFADANAQATQDGFAPLPASQFVSYVEKNSRNGVGDVESAIDVEAVHATAPGATIAYVAGGKGETPGACPRTSPRRSRRRSPTLCSARESRASPSTPPPGTSAPTLRSATSSLRRNRG